MSSENSFENLPYAPWLERALKELITFPVKGICMHAVGRDGAIYTNYHEISMVDKLAIAGSIQQDAMLDMLARNGYISSSEETN